MKMKRNKGFTMAEMLIVVAIIVVLSAVAFIAVPAYLRSMARTEMDGIAKEIFIAAQNHLSMAKSQGYLTSNKPDGDAFWGTPDENEGNGVYYFVAPTPSSPENGDIALSRMLPFGSVDETVRAGGSYIIRYQKDPARILDVFYADPHGRFPCTFTAADYAGLMSGYRGDGNRTKRQNYSGNNNAAIGHYGGEDAETISGIKILAPSIVIHNEDTLWVEVTNPNSSESITTILIVEGLTSGAKASFPASDHITLDDVTSTNKHFAQIPSAIEGKAFLPGENIRVYARSFSTSVFANVAESERLTTNSLYASADLAKNGEAWKITEAHITSIRHLENLDPMVSNLAASTRVPVEKAVQDTDLFWDRSIDTDRGFIGNTLLEHDYITYSSNLTGTAEKTYFPITPDYALTYDGQDHSISDVKVDTTGSAGLFGTLVSNSTVQDLTLLDFDIRSTGTSAGSAGALAGSVPEGCKITNVGARFTEWDENKGVTGKTAGGLVGTLYGTVENSYAAVKVTATGGAAGGLVGTAANAVIKQSYSGGHTENGIYSDTNYNVTGTAAAGGLVGSATGTTVKSCYSTSSAKASGAAGGLVGSVSGGSLENTYATGLVNGADDSTHALVGTGSTTYTTKEVNGADKNTNHYLAIINGTDVAAGPAGAKVDAIDDSITTYNSFLGNTRNPAYAYDTALVEYYRGKYGFLTVSQIGGGEDSPAVHYGDWPAPELNVVNNPST